MLWLPVKRKRFKRIRRLGRFGLRLLLFVVLFFGLGAAAAPPDHALSVHLARVTAPHQFDFIDWESWAVAGEISRRWDPPELPEGDAAQSALVENYLTQQGQINELEHHLNRLYATCPNASLAACPAESRQEAAALQQELALIEAEQSDLKPVVETILSRQLEAVLRDEGFTVRGRAFPPVAFRFIDPPTALIVSPRDRIEKKEFVALAPGLATSDRARIEQPLDRRGDVSSYVTDVGGLGSYPTMVINHAWLPSVVEIIAHEWTHNYFYTFFSNMAWGYQTYPRLTTINETAADIAGKELGRKVITRFYPDWVEHLPPLDQETGQPAPPKPSEFHMAMRRIRQHVDHLLAEGKVEEAEAFMEAERLKLVEKGHNLRKLNQAYFAFHGSYALGPASVDPTGPQLARLRATSPSLKAFLSRVGRLNSYSDYLAWLEEAGIKS